MDPGAGRLRGGLAPDRADAQKASDGNGRAGGGHLGQSSRSTRGRPCGAARTAIRNLAPRHLAAHAFSSGRGAPTK
eukprot:6876522-Pyramimonas_sp.AAC.1